MPIRGAWLGLVAFAGVLSGTAGVLLAQVTEEAGATEDSEASPAFPVLQPGYYRESIRYRNFGGALPPEATAELKRGGGQSAEVANYCAGSGEIQAEAPPWRGPLAADHECRVVAASRDGANGQGEFRCRNNEMSGRITYAGEFQEDSARFTLEGHLMLKNGPGPITFTADVVLSRLSEHCPGETEEAAK